MTVGRTGAGGTFLLAEAPMVNPASDIRPFHPLAIAQLYLWGRIIYFVRLAASIRQLPNMRKVLKPSDESISRMEAMTREAVDTAHVGPKGHMYVPLVVREYLGLKEGDLVVFWKDERGIVWMEKLK